MFPSRFINILICFCLLGYTLLPQALIPCCCTSQPQPSNLSKSPSCCAVEPVKTDCSSRMQMMENSSCPPKLVLGSACPLCRCLQSMQVEVVSGPGIHQTLNRASVDVLHAPHPRTTIRTAALSELAALKKDRGGTVTLLQICVLIC